MQIYEKIIDLELSYELERLMTIREMITDCVNDYVHVHGTDCTMNKKELFQMVSCQCPIKYSSFLPQDYCYNRTNDGILFDGHTHLFEYVEPDCYRLLGENYPYSGPVLHKPRGKKEIIVGMWTQGIVEILQK